MHLLKHESRLCPFVCVSGCTRASPVCSHKGLKHICSLSAFSIAAGHKDNKPVIFAMKHVPLLSSITTNLYATTPYNSDAWNTPSVWNESAQRISESFLGVAFLCFQWSTTSSFGVDYSGFFLILKRLWPHTSFTPLFLVWLRFVWLSPLNSLGHGKLALWPLKLLTLKSCNHQLKTLYSPKECTIGT